MPATRDDSRVLSHGDAAAIAYEVPYDRHPAPGSRGLPLPRTAVEAMSMIAFARQQGITAFWGASPNTEDGDVKTQWIAQGGEHLVVKQGESRCILVSSGVGAAEKMCANAFEPTRAPRSPAGIRRRYARFRACDAKLASGILTVAAAAAPPPPPGDTTRHWFDPRRAPPPPPSIKRASFELYVRREIRPRVEAICDGGLEGAQHREVCLAVATTLSRYQPIYGAGIAAPFCEKICWHSCKGEAHTGGVRKPFKPVLPLALRRAARSRPTMGFWSAPPRAALRTRAWTSCCASARPSRRLRSSASTTRPAPSPRRARPTRRTRRRRRRASRRARRRRRRRSGSSSSAPRRPSRTTTTTARWSTTSRAEAS